MLIDWFTAAAQLVNFLVLVWLLKRFLYKPVLHAIDERETKIARVLAEADAKNAEAQRERDEFVLKNDTFEQQRAALMNKAEADAKTERERLLDQARQEADAWSARREETLLGDAHALNQSIRLRAQQEVFAIARVALTDLADSRLEERMVGVFIRRLSEMDASSKKILGETLRAAPARIRCAYELPESLRTAIQQALNETFTAEINIRFETVPELICGIELVSKGQKLAWSIEDYLRSLEKGVDELLKDKAQPEPGAGK
ncbi:MAG: F0F1 ATP synthase subunit B [Gallionella sp.]|nr:F0F1 ATP synthase subunit B [Gallionella sp.]